MNNTRAVKYDKLAVIKFVAVYLVFGTLWIYFSDSLVGYFINNSVLRTEISILKGVLFIILTSLLFYFLIVRYVKKITISAISLKESEERFHKLIENSPLPITVSRNLKIIYVNKKFAELFGFDDTDEPVGKPIEIRIAAEETEKFLQRAKAREQNLPAENTYETIGIKKDGSRFQILATVSKINLSDGPASVGFFQDITEKRKVENKLKLDESRLKATIKLNQMTKHSIAEITGFTLEEAVNLTGSKLGYLAFLSDDEKILTMHAWSEIAMQECQIKYKPIVYAVETTGLWGEAIRQRKPIITNDYKVLNPFKKGYPEGHIELIRHMNVPIFEGDHIVVLIGVGNKPTDYNEEDTQQLTLLLSSMWQIIQRKNAEKALQQSEEKFRTIVEQFADGFVLVANDGSIIVWNKALEEITGITKEEALKLHYWDVIYKLASPENKTEEQYEYYKTEVLYALSSKELFTPIKSIEANFQKRGGELGVYSQKVFTIILNNQNCFGVIVQDITEMKKNEKIIYESQQRLSLLIQQSPLAVIEWNANAEVIEWNPAAERMFGFSRDEAIGSNLDNLIVSKESSSGFKMKWMETLEIKAGKYFVDEHITKERGVTICEWYFSPVVNSQGELISIATVAVDVTEQKKSLKRIEESEQKFRTVVEQFAEGFSLIDMEGKIIIWNKAIEKITSVPKEKALGNYIWDVAFKLSPLFIKNSDFLSYIKRILLTEMVNVNPSFLNKVMETVIQTPEGKTRTIMHLAFQIEQNDLKHFGVIIQDITQRKDAEEILKESELKFRMLTETTTSAILICKGTKIIYANPSSSVILGYSNTELLNRMNCWDFIHPDFRELFKTREMARQTGETVPSHYEFKIITGKGEERWLDFNAGLIEYEGEEAELATGFDITERKLAEKALRESEGMYRTLVSSIPEAIIRTDLKGNILFINETALPFYRYFPSERILGKNILSFISKEERNRAIENMRTLFKKRKGFSEYTLFFEDGTKLNCEVNGDVLRDDNDKPYEFVFVIHDITERKSAETAVRQSSENFKGIFNNSPYGMVITGIYDDIILEVNKAYLKMQMRTREEVIGKKSMALIDKDAAGKMLNEFKLKGFIENFEYKFVDKNGEDKTYIYSVNLLEFDNKPAALTILKDITELKKAEEELRASEERLNIITQAAFEGIVFSKNFICLDTNKQLLKMLNVNRTDLVGHPMSKFISPQSLELVKEMVQTNNEGPYEFWAMRSNNELFPVEVRARYIDIKGERLRVSVIRDITDRKKSEEQILSLLQRMNDIIELIPDATFIIDQHKKIKYWNRAMEELTGVKKEEIVEKGNYEYTKALYGKRVPTLIDLIDTENKELELQFDYFERDNKFVYAETDFTTLPSGKVASLWSIATPLYDKNGVRFGSIEVIRDITTLKQKEEELNKYKNHLEDLIKERTLELEKVNTLLQEEIIKQKESEEKVKQALIKEKELNELKSRFISIASHEFRTPLATMYSSTEILEIIGQNWDEGKFNTQINKIRKNINSLTEIMDDVLVISRIDSGKIKFDPVETNLENFIEGIVDDIKILLTNKHNLKLSLKVRNKNLLIDEKLLKMALINLLTNAIKYSPDGGEIEFIISQKGKQIQFTIADEGIGIPEKDKQHLFEAFYRASNVGHIRGTGLGLSIVKKYVELHKGSIECISKVQEGTTFNIKIPIE